MKHKRSENMVHGLVREAEQASFSPLVFSTTGGREGRN